MENTKPTVYMRNLHSVPRTIVKGKGCYIWDSEGNQYLDAASGVAVANIGHGVVEVAEAIRKQAENVNFIYGNSVTVDVRQRAAERLVKIAPKGMDHVFFCCGGSEATESMLKMARQYHVEKGNVTKFKVIARWLSYHGNTIASLSMSGRPSWREMYTPYMMNFPHIVQPTCYRCPLGKCYPGCNVACAWELEKTILLEGPESISAFIAEPIIGTTATATAPPKEYYEVIRKICDKYDVLLLMDEVITGIGRTGRNFGIDHYDVKPDMIAVAKGLSGGYVPIGAVITSNEIFDAYYNGSGICNHSFTFGGNPVSCAAADAVLKYVEDNELIARSKNMGTMLLEALKERFLAHPYVGDIRGTGLLVGMEFVSDKNTKAPIPPSSKFTERLGKNAFDSGLIIVPGVRGSANGVEGDHIQITPPFVIEERQVHELVDKLDKALSKTIA